MLLKRRHLLMGLASTAAPSAFAAPPRKSVVVVGAGIIGASVGYHLAAYGADVTIVNRAGPGQETTAKSFAWLNAFNKKPYSYYTLNMLGILGWRRLQQEIGQDLAIQWGGGISWHADEKTAVPETQDIIRRLEGWGYPIRAINRSEVEAHLPGVRTGPCAIAWKSDIDGTVDPVAAAETLVAAAARKGARLAMGTNVLGLDRTGGRVTGVQTSKGLIRADHVVLCMGNDTPPMAATAGLKTPLKESRGVLAHTEPLRPLFGQVVMPPGCDIKQNPDGRLVTGSNFGDSGDTPADGATGEKFLAKVRNFFPHLPPLPLEFMTLGHRVLPVDGHPIVGPSSSDPNVYVAVMHSGMTQAPIMGQCVAMEVLNGVPIDWLSDYRPSRFA